MIYLQLCFFAFAAVVFIWAVAAEIHRILVGYGNTPSGLLIVLFYSFMAASSLITIGRLIW